MDKSKRSFIKIVGVTAIGATCGKPAVSALASALEKPEKLISDGRKKRWAMVIDTKKCLKKEGCNACIEACHIEHNVPKINNPKHEIKWIWKERFENAFPDHVHDYTEQTTKVKPVVVMCNHCDRPPCVRVCPTQATYQNKESIVLMDQHRCIGCRYCMSACPYEARNFNWKDPRPFIENVRNDYPTRTQGVVEKCNFCSERIAKGLLPKCVDACQKQGGGAMVFGDLRNPKSTVSNLLRSQLSLQRKPHLGTNPHVFYL